MDKFIPRDKHIFTQKILGKIDIGVMCTSMVVSNKSIFVFGGYDDGTFTPSAEVRRYDFLDQRWHKMKKMPHYIWAATAQLVDDKIFIMGGGRNATYESYNLVYNINSDSWEEKVKLPIEVKGLVSGVIDGIIYISGGYENVQMRPVWPYCYAYNPKTDTWKECQKSIYYRSFAMSVVIDNFLYVLGGWGEHSVKKNGITMERYCPETDVWEAMPNMPRGRMESIAVAIDSKIFVLCGKMNGAHENYSSKNYITMDYYDTKTRKWTISDIPTPQLTFPGVAMIDNKIYLTGGMDRKKEYNRRLYEITYGGMRE